MVKCRYLLQAPSGYRIELHLENFDIESSVNCKKDVVEVCSVEREGEPRVERLCGKKKSGFVLVSKWSHLIVTFLSDATVTSKGFRMSYNIFFAGIQDDSERILQQDLIAPHLEPKCSQDLQPKTATPSASLSLHQSKGILGNEKANFCEDAHSNCGKWASDFDLLHDTSLPCKDSQVMTLCPFSCGLCPTTNMLCPCLDKQPELLTTFDFHLCKYQNDSEICSKVKHHAHCLRSHAGCNFRRKELLMMEHVFPDCAADVTGSAPCPSGRWGPGCRRHARCYYDGDVRAYRGGVAETAGGVACQRWDAHWPHVLHGEAMPTVGAKANMR